MPRPRRVRVGQLVDEDEGGAAGERRVEIELLERVSVVLDPPAGQRLEAATRRPGLGPAVGLDDPDDDVQPLGPQARAASSMAYVFPTPGARRRTFQLPRGRVPPPPGRGGAMRRDRAGGWPWSKLWRSARPRQEPAPCQESRRLKRCTPRTSLERAGPALRRATAGPTSAASAPTHVMNRMRLSGGCGVGGGRRARCPRRPLSSARLSTSTFTRGHRGTRAGGLRCAGQPGHGPVRRR